MAMIGTGIFQEIKDIFDLPDEVRSFELRIAVNEVVTVKTEFYPNVDGKKLMMVLKKYTLDKRLNITPS